jgi:putative transposase
MTRPYSEDVRELAPTRAEAGETLRSIADSLQIRRSCLPKWKKPRQENGYRPNQIGGQKRTLSADNADRLC